MTVVGRVITPKDFQNITFGGKGNFADVIRGYELSGKEIILIIQIDPVQSYDPLKVKNVSS